MATNDSINKQLQEQPKQPANNKKEGSGTIREILEGNNMQQRFNEVLEDRAPQFTSSVLTLVNNDDLLKKAEPYSVITSAMIAATLNLPIEKSLGYAYIIPYRDRNTGVTSGSFQLGYKGLIQLALRSAQYKAINVTEIYEGELQKYDRLTEQLEIDTSKKESNVVIGYAGFFKLVNGFEKYVYWTREEIEAHRKKYSKSGNVWKNNFDAMAKKTVIRNLLSKWGILSIEMQKGLIREETDPSEYEENNIIDAEVIE